MRNGFFKFGFDSVLRKTVGSVQFRFRFENRRFDFICRTAGKYKKCVSSLFRVCILDDGFSNAFFKKFNLNFESYCI